MNQPENKIATFDRSLPETAAERIRRSIEVLRGDLMPLDGLLSSFEGLMVEQARFRAELPDLSEGFVVDVDPGRFAQGVPLSTAENLADFPEELWTRAALRLLPPMEAGFSGIREDLRKIREVVRLGRLDLRESVREMLQGGEPLLAGVVPDIGVPAPVLAFALARIARPLVEKRAGDWLSSHPVTGWTRGHCPVCGGLPEMGYLKGDGGRQWLRCSFCATDWAFTRLVCPLCGNDDHNKLEYHFVADREHERIEACLACRHYFLNLDLRKRSGEEVLETASIGMVHLDVLARRKGLEPVAVSAWNVMGDSIAGDDVPTMKPGTGPH